MFLIKIFYALVNSKELIILNNFFELKSINNVHATLMNFHYCLKLDL